MKELEIVRYAKMDGIRMFFNTVDYRTAHFHEEWELLWVLDNPLMVKMASKELLLSQGDMILVSPFQVHELQKADESCTFLALQISPQIFRSCPSIGQMAMEDCQVSRWLSPEEYEDLQKAILNMMEYYLNQKSGFQLACISRAANVLYGLLERMPHRELSASEMDSMVRKSDRLSRLQQFVDENYKYPIKLSVFAEQEHVSMTYLSGFIKKELSQSFREYVNQVRFYAALKLMADSHMSLHEICFECGFSDYRYFCKVFQEYTNMSPSDYRKHPKEMSSVSVHVHQSLHSLEKFYSLQISMEMLEKYKIRYNVPTAAAAGFFF